MSCVQDLETSSLFVLNVQTLPHDQRMSVLKTRNLCMNCLKSDHFVKQCPSVHQCRKCQGFHHTLLHIEKSDRGPENSSDMAPKYPVVTPTHVTTGLRANSLLMTSRVKVKASNGATTVARGLLDSASTASFVTERLAQRLHLTCTQQRDVPISSTPVSSTLVWSTN